MSYCSHCGTKLSDGANYCPQCGVAIGHNTAHVQYDDKPKGLWASFMEGWREGDKPKGDTITNQRIVYVQSPQQDIYVHARKSKGLAMTLCFFGGWFGLHEFYLRNYLSGTLYLLFCWSFIPLILSVIDFFLMFFTPKSVFHKMYDK